jgi:hypothetical protein
MPEFGGLLGAVEKGREEHARTQPVPSFRTLFNEKMKALQIRKAIQTINAVMLQKFFPDIELQAALRTVKTTPTCIH